MYDVVMHARGGKTPCVATFDHEAEADALCDDVNQELGYEFLAYFERKPFPGAANEKVAAPLPDPFKNSYRYARRVVRTAPKLPLGVDGIVVLAASRSGEGGTMRHSGTAHNLGDVGCMLDVLREAKDTPYP